VEPGNTDESFPVSQAEIGRTVMAIRIGELARRTGVGVSTRRAWEQRFHFLQPHRSLAGQRLYLEADVERVGAVLRLMSEGLTLRAAIGQVSRVGTGALLTGEGEALLHAQILEAVGLGVWVYRDGRTRYVNRRMAELTRYSVDELVVIPVVDLLVSKGAPSSEERRAIVEAGHRLRFTQALRRADGSTFLAEFDVTPLINRAGQNAGEVAIIDEATACV
jgi:PAS domain S-box-containing protein